MIRSLLALSLLALSAHAESPKDAAAVAAGPECADQVPFYWEIGNAQGILVAGAVQKTRLGVDRNTLMPIASASKWIYGAYVNQVRAGQVTIEDMRFLNMRSGWVRFDQCDPEATVGSCAAEVMLTRRAVNKFDYSGGHFQKHAADIMGLGAMDDEALAATVNGTLGTNFAYIQPQLAGGVVTNAAAYVWFLQRILSGQLVDGQYLHSNAVPTQGPEAISSPVPEAWLYGRGHWIEQDGTVSSPGAFGFYPWLHEQYYGVVARHEVGGAWGSVTCGRAIRRAFLGKS